MANGKVIAIALSTFLGKQQSIPEPDQRSSANASRFSSLAIFSLSRRLIFFLPSASGHQNARFGRDSQRARHRLDGIDESYEFRERLGLNGEFSTDFMDVGLKVLVTRSQAKRKPRKIDPIHV